MVGGACHPSVMGLSPVPAVKNLLANSNLALDDFELIELNEAFAGQYLGCEKELGIDREITNVNGSGIGLGHPVGSTGARIMTTLIYGMKKSRENPWGLPPCAASNRWRRIHGLRPRNLVVIRHGAAIGILGLAQK